jgi:hypothetical protein
MPTTDLFPDATGNYAQWTVGAGSRPTCVQTNDGNTSRIDALAGSTPMDSYSCDDLPASAALVNTVIIRSYTRREGAGAGNSNHFTRLGGVDQAEPAFAHALSYTLRSDTVATPPGGGSWDVADVNGLEAGINHGSSGASDVRCTQIFLNVDYTDAGFGFITFFEILLPLIGGQLSFQEFVGALQLITLRHRNRPRWKRHEILKMWDEYKAWSRPSYLLLSR